MITGRQLTGSKASFFKGNPTALISEAAAGALSMVHPACMYDLHRMQMYFAY